MAIREPGRGSHVRKTNVIEVERRLQVLAGDLTNVRADLRKLNETILLAEEALEEKRFERESLVHRINEISQCMHSLREELSR